MTKVYYQSIAQFYIELDDEGKPIGSPKFLKGWTSPMYGTKKEKKVKPKELTVKAEEEIIL